ncbi:MAG: phosphocholine cytidylyltransferase family protein [Saprospirales bacterium]|nr:MAG: phosphocholine cytidylyltransferase family protein [Saprospirales bacterium]
MKNNPKTAVILLAGRGSRLKEITNDIPKCLIKINQKTILERTLDNLIAYGIQQCILVLGYRKEQIKEVCKSYSDRLAFDFVLNDKWCQSNNILSLYLATHWIKGDFLLLEGDILFSENALNSFSHLNSLAVDNFSSFMDGTVVEINKMGFVKKFYLKTNPEMPNDLSQYFKTVNIYSFDLSDFNNFIFPELEALIQRNQINEYYELAFANAVDKCGFKFKVIRFSHFRWAEIDDQKDLFYAERLFRR